MRSQSTRGTERFGESFFGRKRQRRRLTILIDICSTFYIIQAHNVLTLYVLFSTILLASYCYNAALAYSLLFLTRLLYYFVYNSQRQIESLITYLRLYISIDLPKLPNPETRSRYNDNFSPKILFSLLDYFWLIEEIAWDIYRQQGNHIC